jgi:NADH-quinone oxidoreductase subunit J
MTLDTIIFGISAVVAVFGAVMMISQRNPVASVLYLILSFVAQAVLYIQLSAMFVAVMLVIVYAGAILVLFLFVIMLLNLRGTEDLGKHSAPISLFAKGAVSFLLLVELLFVIRGLYIEAPRAGVMTMQPETFGTVKSVALLLFTKYLYPFELTGVLLLAAVVGAVVTARHEHPGDTEEGLDMQEPSTEKPQDKVTE